MFAKAPLPSTPTAETRSRFETSPLIRFNKGLVKPEIENPAPYNVPVNSLVI